MKNVYGRSALRSPSFSSLRVYATGTVSVTNGSTAVSGSGTAWTFSMVGLQFRSGSIAPVYTIVSVGSPTSLIIDQVYGGATATGLTYNILQAYVTPPTDFLDFLSVKDPAFNWQLHLHVSQQWINSFDAQRANAGTACALVDFRYANSPQSGSVSQPVVVVGTAGDPLPVISGPYTGLTDSIFVVTVTTGGISGTSQFTWVKDNQAVQGPIPTTAAPQLLQEGVSIQWPTPSSYVLNDVFVFKVRPGLVSTLPQYELWPYQTSQIRSCTISACATSRTPAVCCP